MIVKFTDLGTLQLVLTTGAVPPDVAAKPAIAGFDGEQQIWVETKAKLPVAAQSELKRLGAHVCKSSSVDRNTPVSCWLELLPLVRDAVPLDTLGKTPVLFDVAGGAELSRLVLEMLRLGNDRQGYRWIEETKTAENRRALLRVVGPPYYSLLRAIDRIGGAEIAPYAFMERAPRVWVEIGYRHPLESNIRAPKGKILLLRPPRQWTILADAPFRDIYDIVEFQIPDGPAQWEDCPLPHRIEVAPRLRQAGSVDGTELWVLRGEAVEELNRFVQNAEDQLLHRLAFAVGQKNGQTIVVLRVRQAKQPPPVLVLPAEAYKNHLKLPNLFVPAGYALHPPLRRDVVRKLLAEDPSRITWLVPSENGEFSGSFTPETLSDEGFRPLTEWVDYVLDRDREPLQAWMQAMQFEFEPFVCDEENAGKPKKPPPAEKKRNAKAAPTQPAGEGEMGAATAFEPRAETAADEIIQEAFSAIEKMEPSAIEKELHAVEEEFLALAGGLDDEAHRVLWPRLADLNARLSKWQDAGICWMNALWEDGGNADRWTAFWFRTESQSTRHDLTHSGERIADNLDSLLSLPDPATADLRALAAYLAWSARREARPEALMQRLPALQRFLETHEKLLPVRACWLAWYHLTQLTDGDVLALARARDRLLERLFHNGLRPEQDLPSFLRFSGHPDSQRRRENRDWLKRLCEKVRGWIEDNRDILDRKPPTRAYADLLFAFGLARVGESEDAKRLLQRARGTLGGEDLVHRFLLAAFESRIQNVLDGKPHTGPLPQSFLEELESMPQLEKYLIERVRHNSRILEPDRQVNPYRHWAARQSDLDRALVELTDLNDRLEIQTRIRNLLGKTQRGQASGEDRAKILRAGLELSPYVGEEFAREMLQQTLPALKGLAEPSDHTVLNERAKFLEKALFTAAHFGCTEYVRPLVAGFHDMLRTQRGSQGIESIGALAEQSFRSLRKLGLHDDIEKLLGEMAEGILQGKSVDALVRSFDSRNDALAPLCALLHVAGAWYFFGRDRLAEPVVQAARALLFGSKLTQATQRRDLACTYARTVGQAPPTVTLVRLEEIFTLLKNYRDTFTTSSHFSVVQMDLVEAVVLAVVNDDFTQGAQVRRWLDEDEYLVRQRIHSDVRQLMGQR